MKILKTWLLIGALFCGNALAQVDPPSQVGRLSYLSGTVSFAPAEAGNEWTVAPLNRPVTNGDRLWADRDGRAEMRIGSTAIRVGALTSMDVLRLDDDATQLRLAQGTLNINLRRLDPDNSFEISTPGGAVLLTQPGSYRVQVDPSGATTTVLVRRGQADVLTGNAPVPLRDNQMLILSNQGQDVIAATPPDEFDNWAAARDRQEERVVSTRYVPQEMTGYEDLDQYGAWQSEAQYGNVWIPSAVPAGWAPYRDGRWVWVSPWGWTWVDSAPWGFAPYHYGRWVWLRNRWAWAPGERVARPVYAPALVAFVGGSNWSVSVGAGPAVGWVPLGWREPYIPWYAHSPNYVRNVNITHVNNITVINQYANANNGPRIRYANRDVPSGMTVVSRDTFVSARRVHDAHLTVPANALAAARITHEAPVGRPERQSFGATRPGTRLPESVAAREVVAARAPLAPARFANDNAPGNNRNAAEDRPRVRVLNTQSGARTRGPDAAPQPAAAPTPQPAIINPAAPPAAITPPVAAPRAVPPQARERTPDHTPGAVPQPRPPQERREASPQANPAAPPAPNPADAQRKAQEQHDRQARDEQQRQARAAERQQQQQRLQEQKDRQHQAVQQRAQEVQQQRERQFQQAQQVQQQQQARQQQAREQRQAEQQAERQRQAAQRAPQPQAAPAPAARERRTPDGERPPHQR